MNFNTAAQNIFPKALLNLVTIRFVFKKINLVVSIITPLFPKVKSSS